jgi:hypothetical protein
MAGMLDLWDLWLSLESPHYSRYLEMRGGLLILKNIYIVYIAARGMGGHCICWKGVYILDIERRKKGGLCR